MINRVITDERRYHTAATAYEIVQSSSVCLCRELILFLSPFLAFPSAHAREITHVCVTCIYPFDANECGYYRTRIIHFQDNCGNGVDDSAAYDPRQVGIA